MKRRTRVIQLLRETRRELPDRSNLLQLMAASREHREKGAQATDTRESAPVQDQVPSVLALTNSRSRSCNGAVEHVENNFDGFVDDSCPSASRALTTIRPPRLHAARRRHSTTWTHSSHTVVLERTGYPPSDAHRIHISSGNVIGGNLLGSSCTRRAQCHTSVTD